MAQKTAVETKPKKPALTTKPQEKKDTPPSIWRSRSFTLSIAGGVGAAGLAVKFTPNLPASIDQFLGNPGSAQIFATSSIFLSLVMGLAFYIGVRFPFHLDPLESKNAATLQISGFGGPLKAEKILGEEFKYASKTAEQAMEHRMTIVNYYLLIVGGGGSGVIALINANHAGNRCGATALVGFHLRRIELAAHYCAASRMGWQHYGNELYQRVLHCQRGRVCQG